MVSTNRIVLLVLSMLCCCTVCIGQQCIKESLIWQNVGNGPQLNSTYSSNHGSISFKGDIPYYICLLGTLETNESFEVDLRNSKYEYTDAIRGSLRGDSADLQVYYVWEKKIKIGFVKVNPYRFNPAANSLERLVSFELKIIRKQNLEPYDRQSSFAKSGSWASSSLLASSKWIRIDVSKTGIYKLDYNYLQVTGLPINGAKVSDIKLYGFGGGMLPEINNDSTRKDDLVENAIKVVDVNNNGTFDPEDYLLFYGESSLVWDHTLVGKTYNHKQHIYSNRTSYFITINNVVGKRIGLQASDSRTPNYTSKAYDFLYVHEIEEINLIKSGRKWYGELFEKNLSYNFNVPVPGLRQDDEIVMKTIGVARSSTNCAFETAVNGQTILNYPIDGITFSYDRDYIDYPQEQKVSFKSSNQDLNIEYKYIKTSSDALAWLDYFEIQARCDLNMQGSQMVFRDQYSINADRVTNFIMNESGKQVSIWEITDKRNIQEQQISRNGNSVSYVLPTTTLRTFIAFDGTSFLNPDKWEQVENQNLHSLQGVDMVIVSAPTLINEAKRLAEHRSNKSNIRVTVVTPQQIYNEYSSGVQDISAIRNFMKMFYDRAISPEEMPKYLLLFGEASYDYKDRIADNSNMVPTYQSDNSYSPTESYASDDFFALLDDIEGAWLDDESLDIAVGRIPARTIEQARVAVDKIIYYESEKTFGKWRNNIGFFGDDGDNNQHIVYFEYSEPDIVKEAPYVNLDKIYVDAYNQIEVGNGQRSPETRRKLEDRFENGALVISFLGHGGGKQLTAEQILDLPLINNFSNLDNMPLFTTATCEFTRYDDPGEYPAGEQLFFNPKGGAISLITTSRLIFIGPHGNITQAIFKDNLFKKVNGKYMTQGDVNSRMKNAVNQGANERCIILVGDPSMTLAYPKEKIVTTGINGLMLDTSTVGALSKIEIKGEIQDNVGNKLSGFNGSINITVYDKPSTITTKGNESLPYTFKAYNNIIFNGKYSVVQGSFSATFICPKDISYESGIGKISYYASNVNTDATGSYNSLRIFGTDSLARYENDAPQIRLYMNDTTFKFGGYTDESPSLFALVYDESGINTSNTGIGREITAVVDNDMENVLVLNDYYEAELNSYQNGIVKYPFKDLPEGRHSVKLKVWDVQNNSSEAYTEFIVVENGKVALEKIFNYPNPFSDQTTFSFQHNQGNRFIDVSIEIVDFKGALIRTLTGAFTDPSATFDQITWDGNSENGMLVPPGVYIYRITLGTQSGVKAYKSEKLVVIRP